MKILLNSLYGATALPSFRYGMNFQTLSEAITLSVATELYKNQLYVLTDI